MSEGLSREAHEKWAEVVFVYDNFVLLPKIIDTTPALRLAAWSALTSYQLGESQQLFDDDGNDELVRYMKMPEIRLPVWFYFLACSPTVERLRAVAEHVPELREAAEAAIRVHPEAKAMAAMEAVAR